MSEPASLDFGLGEMADTIRETTERFAREKIAPIAAEIDETDEFPRHLWPQMGELGLHGITVAEEDGGLGLGYLEHVVAQEEVARASGSVGLSYGAHSNLCINQIRRWANPEQKKQFLPKLIARKMLVMVHRINGQDFGVTDMKDIKVTCYTCHRGSTKPLTMAPAAEPAPAAPAPKATERG